MRHVTQYFSSLWQSVSSVTFYGFVLRQPLRWTAIFFFISYIWLGWLAAGRFVVRDIPDLTQLFDATAQEVEANYPADLQLTWDEQAFTHQPEGLLTISYPPFVAPAEYSLPSVLAYHANQPLTSDQLPTSLPQPSFLVFTTKELFLHASDGSWSSIPLTEVPGFEQSFQVTRAQLPNIISHLKSVFQNLLNVVGTLSFVALPLSLALHRAWLVLIQSLLAYLLLKLNGVPLTFTKTFQLGLHIMVVAEILNQVSLWLYPQLDWSLLTIGYWLIFTLIILRVKMGKSSASEAG